MKPIRIVLSPTRSRPVNIFLGMVLILVSLLLFLALASYRASDPSLNTATDLVAPKNWTGVFGAYFSDLLLQTFGLTSFLLPIWLGSVGWTWMHSRPGGSPLLRWMGTLLSVAFLPAVFGLLPWHWRWLHEIAIEGVVGRIIAGFLVVYLNIQGAWVVALASPPPDSTSHPPSASPRFAKFSSTAGSPSPRSASAGATPEKNVTSSAQNAKHGKKGVHRLFRSRRSLLRPALIRKKSFPRAASLVSSDSSAAASQR